MLQIKHELPLPLKYFSQNGYPLNSTESLQVALMPQLIGIGASFSLSIYVFTFER